MKYAATQNGSYTGVIYDKLTQSIQDWADHTDGISLVAIDDATEAAIKAAEMQADDGEPDYPSVDNDALALTARDKRDNLINQVIPRVQRYQTQKAANISTDDSESWYQDALQLLQDLRNVPQQKGFPDDIDWPDYEGYLAL